MPLPSFGSEDYSKEELIAEIGAAFLCGTVGLDVESEVEASASYPAHWLAALKDDRRLVVSAAAYAQRAADFIRGDTMAQAEPRDSVAMALATGAG